MKTKELVLTLGSGLAIAAATLFIWKNYLAAPKINVALHQAIGAALAEETIKALDNRGDILVITMADGDSEMLATQFAAFRVRLEKSSVRIKDVALIASEKKADYGPGRGLSASKLARELQKNTKKAALVSFVGLPKLDAEDFVALGEVVPPLLAFSRDADKLGPLLRRGLVRAAVVPRFKFPAPGPDTPRTPGEWFTNQYQVVRAPTAPAR